MNKIYEIEVQNVQKDDLTKIWKDLKGEKKTYIMPMH